MFKTLDKAVHQTQKEDNQRREPIYIPRANIHENDNAFIITMEMPGVAKDGLNITLDKHVLTIEGEVKPSDQKLTPYYKEYNERNYRRSFRLSSDIEMDKIEAVLKDGILRISLPKVAEVKPRKIEIQS